MEVEAEGSEVQSHPSIIRSSTHLGGSGAGIGMGLGDFLMIILSRAMIGICRYDLGGWKFFVFRSSHGNSFELA